METTVALPTRLTNVSDLALADGSVYLSSFHHDPCQTKLYTSHLCLLGNFIAGLLDPRNFRPEENDLTAGTC